MNRILKMQAECSAAAKSIAHRITSPYSLVWSANLEEEVHTFVDLIDRGTALILRSLNETREGLMESAKTSASTALVKNLQMIELQRAIGFYFRPIRDRITHQGVEFGT
jgi:hypothetical protein